MDLVEQIKAAFADTRYPGDHRITNCPYDCLECRDIARYFRGTTWQQHTVTTLQFQDAALSFFTPEAFHYYLPGFMLAVIEDAETADMICDSIVFHFSPHSEDWMPEFNKRMALFSQEQRAAVVAYLHWFGSTIGDDDYVEEAIAMIAAT